MKDTLASGIAGIFMGAIVMYGYMYISSGDQNQTLPERPMGQETGEMTEERLEQISERTGMTQEEIQKRLDSGESIRDITGGIGGARPQ